jgi:hypothetical protein
VDELASEGESATSKKGGKRARTTSGKGAAPRKRTRTRKETAAMSGAIPVEIDLRGMHPGRASFAQPGAPPMADLNGLAEVPALLALVRSFNFIDLPQINSPQNRRGGSYRCWFGNRECDTGALGVICAPCARSKASCPNVWSVRQRMGLTNFLGQSLAAASNSRKTFDLIFLLFTDKFFFLSRT